MPYRLLLGAVPESRRQVTYVVRVQDGILPRTDIDEISARMRERCARRNQRRGGRRAGHSRQTMRLFGSPYSVWLVRAAMLKETVGWLPLESFLAM